MKLFAFHEICTHMIEIVKAASGGSNMPMDMADDLNIRMQVPMVVVDVCVHMRILKQF